MTAYLAKITEQIHLGDTSGILFTIVLIVWFWEIPWKWQYALKGNITFDYKDDHDSERIAWIKSKLFKQYSHLHKNIERVHEYISDEYIELIHFGKNKIDMSFCPIQNKCPF